MTTRFKKPEEPLHTNNLERAIDRHNMNYGVEHLQKSKETLENKEELSSQEQGQLRSINKMIEQISNDIKSVEDAMLDNIDTSKEEAN